MGQSTNIRYTLNVQDYGYNDREPYLYGVYTDYIRAENLAARWERILRKNGRPHATVSVIMISPATAGYRDQHWPAR